MYSRPVISPANCSYGNLFICQDVLVVSWVTESWSSAVVDHEQLIVRKMHLYFKIFLSVLIVESE